MAQKKKFKYVVEVVLTFDEKWPKKDVIAMVEHRLGAHVRSVDLE